MRGGEGKRETNRSTLLVTAITFNPDNGLAFENNTAVPVNVVRDSDVVDEIRTAGNVQPLTIERERVIQ